jgi:hypothetical protein
MKTLLLLVVALSLLTVPALAEQLVKGEVRDPSCKLLYTTPPEILHDSEESSVS